MAFLTWNDIWVAVNTPFVHVGGPAFSLRILLLLAAVVTALVLVTRSATATWPSSFVFGAKL